MAFLLDSLLINYVECALLIQFFQNKLLFDNDIEQVKPLYFFLLGGFML